MAEADRGDLVRKQLAALHPQTLSDLDPDVVERFREASKETVAMLLEGPHAGALDVTNALSVGADAASVTADDRGARADAALRLLLVCQFNGFRSGLVSERKRTRACAPLHCHASGVLHHDYVILGVLDCFFFCPARSVCTSPAVLVTLPSLLLAYAH